jgi:predicted ester cyclase
MTIRALLVVALGAGLATVPSCKKKEDNANTGGTAPQPMDPAGSAAAKPTEPAQPAKPAKLNPKTGQEMIGAYQECTGYISSNKLDEFKTKCVADDYKGHEVDGMEIANADTLVDWFKGQWAAFPDMKMQPQMVFASGKNLLAVGLVTGTHTGPLKTPMGEIPATNKKIGMMFFHRIQIGENGGAAEEWVYNDPGTMMFQLGQAPKNMPPKRTAMTTGLPGAPITAITADDDKEKKNIEVVNKFHAAVNAHKPADIAALVTDDAVESDQSYEKDAVGKKAIQDGMANLFKAFSDFKVDVPTTYAAGDYVIGLGTYGGTNSGDISPKIKKTGKSMTGGFAQIYKIKDGKISNLWRFRNGMAVAQQLGLMQPPGAPGGEGAAKGEPAKGAAGKDAAKGDKGAKADKKDAPQ